MSQVIGITSQVIRTRVPHLVRTNTVRDDVSEIAALCGYDSHSRFTAAFRQRFGYAPSHMRP